MDPSPGSILIDFLPLLGLLFLSAFFSGSETAFFSLNKTTLAVLENDENRASKRVYRLIQHPQMLLITILICNNVVNVFIAAESTLATQAMAAAYDWDPTWTLIINIFAVSFFILMFGEILPKIYAVKDPLWFAKRCSRIIAMFRILIYPVAWGISRYTNVVTSSLKAKLAHPGFSEEELKTLIDISEESGTIETEEKEMISSIMDFGDTTVKEIMVPRIDMTTVREDATLDELVEIAKSSHYSRIPVYRDRIDNIIGLIYIKDLIHEMSNRAGDAGISDLVHDGYYVPEQKKIQDLLKEFQTHQMHMAVVVDEYGGTSGLVTLEDILEEIVGEIQDEYDSEAPLYEQLNDSTYRIDGRMPIEECNELLPIELPEAEDIETISGFIHHITGNLPAESDVISYENLVFEIERIDHHRIDKIRLTVNEEIPGETSESTE